MDTIKLLALVEKVESIFTQIKYLRKEEQISSPSTLQLTDLKTALNNLFTEYSNGPVCTDIIYTANYDKQFMGLYINPLLNYGDAISIIATEEPVTCRQYQLELGSDLLDMDLDAEEITAIVLHEISSMLCNAQVIEDLRNIIHLEVLSTEDVVRLRDNINYSQLLMYAIKDTLYKVSSMIFKEDIEEMTSNPLIQAAELVDAMESAQEKLVNNVYGLSDSARSPKVTILKWAFMIYQDVQHNSRLARETLLDSKDFTASILQKQEIDKTIIALDRIDATTLMENANIVKVLEKKALHSVTEGSIFKSLKQSGLKSIENDLYELAIKAKAMECEDDALFIIRAINTRLGILEDYIYNTELSENEAKKWNAVANSYRELRETVVKSKVFKKKSYGLFFDYNQLDQYDESFEMEPVRESVFTKYVKIPKEMRLVDADFLNASVLKSKSEKLLKFLVDNKAPEKQLSFMSANMYWGLVGATFSQGTESGISHTGDTVTFVIQKYVSKYCIDKIKARIKKDIEDTITGLNRIEASGKKDLTKLQEQWRADILKAVKYL